MTTAISALPITQKVGWTGRGYIINTADGVFTFNNAGGTLSASMTVGAAGLVTFGAGVSVSGQIKALGNNIIARDAGDSQSLALIGGTGQVAVLNTGQIGFSSTSGAGGALDVILNRDAANVLALRNGVSAQTFIVSNTYTDASNYERGFLGWLSNVYRIGTANAGTGTYRSTEIVGNGITFTSKSDGSTTWSMNGNGHLLANADNTYDIGASGATRPRNIYVGTSVKASNLEFTGSTIIQGAGDGVFKPTKNAGGQLTVATLPAAATAGAGARAFVTDANASTFASVVAAGGANGVPVYSDGTNWRIG